MITIRHIVDVNIHLKNSQDNEIIQLLKQIFNQNKNTMGALEDIKDKLAISDQKIDILVPAVDGVAKDIQFLKKKLEGSPGGINEAGVAELLGIVTAQNEKLSTASEKLAAIDSETNSDEEQPPV